MTKTRYTLHYFDTRGRAEPIRLLLSHVGASWEDHGFPNTDWPKLKGEMPLGQAPVLVEHRESGDVKIPQTMAIIRHLARVYGVEGKTEDEHLAADIAAETAVDMGGALNRLRFSPAWQDAAAKEKYEKETVPQHLARFEKLLGERGWLAGEGPTYGDLVAFTTIESHVHFFPNILADHPRITSWLDRIRALPTLSAYLAKRRPA